MVVAVTVGHFLRLKWRWFNIFYSRGNYFSISRSYSVVQYLFRMTLCFLNLRQQQHDDQQHDCKITDILLIFNCSLIWGVSYITLSDIWAFVSLISICWHQLSTWKYFSSPPVSPSLHWTSPMWRLKWEPAGSILVLMLLVRVSATRFVQYLSEYFSYHVSQVCGEDWFRRRRKEWEILDFCFLYLFNLVKCYRSECEAKKARVRVKCRSKKFEICPKECARKFNKS